MRKEGERKRKSQPEFFRGFPRIPLPGKKSALESFQCRNSIDKFLSQKDKSAATLPLQLAASYDEKRTETTRRAEISYAMKSTVITFCHSTASSNGNEDKALRRCFRCESV